MSQSKRVPLSQKASQTLKKHGFYSDFWLFRLLCDIVTLLLYIINFQKKVVVYKCIENSLGRFFGFCHTVTKSVTKRKWSVPMLDFYEISYAKKGKPGMEFFEVFPDFKVRRFRDLMVRGGAFYAVWNEETGLWSTDEYDVQRLIDADLRGFAEKLEEDKGLPVKVKYLKDFSSSSWTQFRLFLSKLSDNFRQLDVTVAFSNTEVRKEDYISTRLPYPLEDGETLAFDALFRTVYDEENLTKLMWAIGSIFAGDSKRIQKFFVLFGMPGTGKSTSLNLLERLFGTHVASFEAGQLTNATSNFAIEAFKNNPLVGIDHEGDLSNVKNNSVLSSVVSHDKIVVNVKYQHPFSIRLNTMLFIATNKPVMITERASGIIRRLIDIRPTGRVVSARDYESLNAQMEFELGAIAYKCLSLYRQLGKNYYNRYVPLDMILRTNVFFNFVDEYYPEFVREDMVTLTRAWDMYKQFCDEAGITKRMARHAFRDELKTYWREFHPITRIDGIQMRSVYVGFNTSVFEEESSLSKGKPVVYDWLSLSERPSIFDREHSDRPAQLATKKGLPRNKWEDVTTTISDIDTGRLHYVLPKENLITLDFDLRDENGEKSLELNVEAARKFPPTYVETSKSGKGLHLHYYYDGDISRLSRIYEEGIEILRPVGNFSIRRKLSLCNDHAITTINSGLPLKPDPGDKMISKKTLSNERALRAVLLRSMHKEIHPATKPSIDFIDHVLSEAYEQGLRYDVSDLKPYILDFASKSTNNAAYCVTKALSMKYASDHDERDDFESPDDDRLVFFDVEVFPNLLVVCWKYEGEDEVVRMINPRSDEIESLIKARLVGFNNRRYDNHILYARYLGYTREQIYHLSKRIISNDRTAYFREAYGISHVDVYDYATEKKSLKKWQVDLGIFHSEVDVDWDAPLPEELWDVVVEYCVNDVISTEVVHKTRIEDYHARQILAELSGQPINSSTLVHTSRIVFGNDRNAKEKFNYPDLSEEFPGYVFDKGQSVYHDEVVGEGGYVYAVPGMYHNVAYLDVASMHPSSIEIMQLFGPYTERYSALKQARILIKQGKLEEAGRMFDGALAKYLEDSTSSSGLAYALKIALNIVYGYTAASFDNPFRDPRNKDNVVAKRGALFMVDLKRALQDRGVDIIHIKTDSVKIANYTQEDIDFVFEFGRRYGYEFGIEKIYDTMVLINDAVLIGRVNVEGNNESPIFDAVGARFAHPYVHKALFTREPIEFEDMVESRSVAKGEMYIEMDDGRMVFVGRVGIFCPMETSGGSLIRVTDDKKFAVTATKGYRWQQAQVVRELGLEDDIDRRYFEAMVQEALDKIAEFGDPNIILGD